jgi:hypothetical protein
VKLDKLFEAIALQLGDRKTPEELDDFIIELLHFMVNYVDHAEIEQARQDNFHENYLICRISAIKCTFTVMIQTYAREVQFRHHDNEFHDKYINGFDNTTIMSINELRYTVYEYVMDVLRHEISILRSAMVYTNDKAVLAIKFKHEGALYPLARLIYDEHQRRLVAIEDDILDNLLTKSFDTLIPYLNEKIALTDL